MTILGAIATPYEPPEGLAAIAALAEAEGLAELWLWEDAFHVGGIASAATILGATRRLRVGVGVLPFPLRNVGLAAMEVATLERMHPGRFVAGFGHGVQEWMAQAGVRPRSVLTLEREYVAALRGLLAGEEVTVSGEYVRLDAVRLGWPPVSVPPLHLAARGPKSLHASGLLGDGTVIDAGTSLDELTGMLDLVAAGRAESGRGGANEITYFLPAAPEDPAPAIAAIERLIALGVDRILLQPEEGARGTTPDLVRLVAGDLQSRFAG